MNVAQSIKFALVKKGMSQLALAEKIGSSPSYVSELSNGKATPSEQMLKRICEALEMKVSDFIALGED